MLDSPLLVTCSGAAAVGKLVGILTTFSYPHSLLVTCSGAAAVGKLEGILTTFPYPYSLLVTCSGAAAVDLPVIERRHQQRLRVE